MANTDYKIYRYLEPWQLPSSLDVHPGHIIFPDQLNKNLPKEPTIYLGERRKSTYYDRFENGEYVDPIIKIAYAFKRDDKGFVYEKVKTIVWCLKDDNWSSQTQIDFIPVVSESEKIIEIKRRRTNIINELKGLAKKFDTVELPLESRILTVMEENQLLVNSYIDAGSAKFRDAIAQSNADWLDEVVVATGNKPRDIFLTYLSIGLAV